MGEKCVKWYGAGNFMQSLKGTKTSFIHTKHSRFMLIFGFNYYYVPMSWFKKTKTLGGSFKTRNGFEIGTFSQLNVMHEMIF